MMCANNPLSFIILNMGCFATACILHALIGCDLKSQQKKQKKKHNAFSRSFAFLFAVFFMLFFACEMYLKTYVNS